MTQIMTEIPSHSGWHRPLRFLSAIQLMQYFSTMAERNNRASAQFRTGAFLQFQASASCHFSLSFIDAYLSSRTLENARCDNYAVMVIALVPVLAPSLVVNVMVAKPAPTQ